MAPSGHFLFKPPRHYGIQQSMVDDMDKTKVNFFCPSATVKIIDEMAAADHRDRTSMLNKIVDFYLSLNNPHSEPRTNGARRTATKKKAGAR